jgi:hypothetical protein
MLIDRELKPALLRWELPMVCLLAWVAMISIPLAQGGIGLSWDALNHHIYLGWTAETHRFDRDFLAASYQAYQFPYLYWPVYKLAMAGWSGAAAGVVLGTLHLLVVPPVWMLARTCMPGPSVYDLVMRWLGVVLAFMTAVVISLFDSSSNDLMAAMPFVWALALAMEPFNSSRPSWLTSGRAILLSGIFAGAAVAFKLSNGPLALILPAVWLLTAIGDLKRKLVQAVWGGVAILLAYVLVYGYWGVQLWTQFGNPIYPFYDSLFAHLRVVLGWAP